MIYRNVDEIPAKIFFKIAEKGDLSLLSTEPTKEDLVSIWESIVEQDRELTGGKKRQKNLNIKKEITALQLHQKTVQNCIYILRETEDEGAKQVLQNLNYQFTGNLSSDLDKIERYAGDLSVKLKQWEDKLPTNEEIKQKKLTNFDQTVISYSIITELGFIDTNTITLSQFRGLESATKQKVSTLKNGKKR
jgi:hypothetical protein